MRLRTAFTARALIVACAVVAITPALVSNGPAGAWPTAVVARDATPAAPSLDSFGDCDTLLAHLQAVAEAHVTPYGFGSPYYGVFGAVGNNIGEGVAGISSSAASAASTSALADTSAAANFSGTNDQEAGVDEDDTVKTDGKRLVVLQNGVLSTFDVANPAKPALRARLVLADPQGSYGDTILLSGNRVLAMLPRFAAFAPPPGEPAGVDYGGGETVTDVVMISIADVARPKVLDRVTFNGSRVAARLVGGSARLVVDSIPLDLAFVTPQSDRAAAVALATNRQVIANSTIDDWLPTIQRGGTTTPAVDCTDVHTPSQFAGVGMTTIETIPMGDQVQPTSVSLQADSDTVYASATHLFVTESEWFDPETYNSPLVWEGLATSYRTDIHEFDISGSQASYVASGQVRGHPLDQYSLSELNGQLRIATTDGPTWGRPPGATGPTSQSFVTVFAPQGTRLAQVGQVGGIGRNQTIQAVRFAGNAAYVATAAQFDPFVVIDLANPAHPKVAGQIKVAGVSAYLHPISATRILGVGIDINRHGQYSGARVSLFDVSHPSAPKLLSTWAIPGTYTQVDYDAKAFLWWAPTDLAVIPTETWGPFKATGAIGLRVSSKAVLPVGFVSHALPKVIGHTACRPFTAAQVKQAEPHGLAGGKTSRWIDCAPNQPVAIIGYSCDTLTPAQASQYYTAHFAIPKGHVLGFCYPTGAPLINRSIVIGNRLLTLSNDLLLSSDLKTLKPGVFVAY